MAFPIIIGPFPDEDSAAAWVARNRSKYPPGTVIQCAKCGGGGAPKRNHVYIFLPSQRLQEAYAFESRDWEALPPEVLVATGPANLDSAVA